jgi:large subunit ribosomal protein L37Ae
MNTPKYSAKLRNLYDAAQKSKRAKYACPKCGKVSLGRTSYAMWECKSCGAKVAGGAFSPTTEAGEIANRMLNRGQAES